ncbi:hypothetical protein BpHYR1_032113 [Brachionus plicatilis]|uniref:Uncharacterized protein n=1 Tax=Brachionus plicatilis TaxID=10195 RepID=A0A3M7RC92_BRAPC|nr:hypothetical protein BpHYR1_032113 [Brachionus plicatilis]
MRNTADVNFALIKLVFFIAHVKYCFTILVQSLDALETIVVWAILSKDFKMTILIKTLEMKFFNKLNQIFHANSLQDLF